MLGDAILYAARRATSSAVENVERKAGWIAGGSAFLLCALISALILAYHVAEPRVGAVAAVAIIGAACLLIGLICLSLPGIIKHAERQRTRGRQECLARRHDDGSGRRRKPGTPSTISARCSGWRSVSVWHWSCPQAKRLSLRRGHHPPYLGCTGRTAAMMFVCTIPSIGPTLSQDRFARVVVAVAIELHDDLLLVELEHVDELAIGQLQRIEVVDHRGRVSHLEKLDKQEDVDHRFFQSLVCGKDNAWKRRVDVC